MSISVSEIRSRQLTSVGRSERAVAATAAYVQHSERGLYRRFVKRALDVIAVLFSAPVVVPLVLILAFLVAREGGRPFYSQFRVGKNGRPFRMWKLRTMVTDADARMTAYLDANPQARAEWDLNQKLRVDPRITRFGQVLRKTSLDELPQLWNVFCGDMSLVGPRPMMLNQQGMYPGKAYYLVRPGVTGLWQTTDRNQTSFEARAEFDNIYNDTLSFGADTRIILKTVGVVLKGTGY